MIGMKASFTFHANKVHEFESFPTDEEASNEYESKNEEMQVNHAYVGKMDGDVAIPTLKSKGPYAKLVTALKRAKQDSEMFLKDKVEGPLSTRHYDQ